MATFQSKPSDDSSYDGNKEELNNGTTENRIVPVPFLVKVEQNDEKNETAEHFIEMPEIHDKRMEVCFMAALEYAANSTIVYYDCKSYCFNGVYHNLATKGMLFGAGVRVLRECHIEPLHSEVNFFISNAIDKAAAISIENPMRVPNDPRFWLFMNGSIDVITQKYYKPSAMYFATGAINAQFIPQLAKQCPTFMKLLHDISDGDTTLIQFLLEVFAYLLSPEYRLKNIFCFIGVGDSGKSLLLNVLQALLTPELVTNMSVENFTNSRFALSEMKDKRLCIASDEADFHFDDRSAAVLKQISGGGETVTTDVKNKSQVRFLMTAKLVITEFNFVD